MSAPPVLAPPAEGARSLLGVASVVVLGAVLSILDTTVVNVAIDTLGRSFDAPLATIQWVATGYLLALATAIPLTGWAADRFGARRLFCVAVALFTAGSALAGAAWSAESLIAFRVLQGLGGGMILPAGITLVGHAAGPRRMGRVMGWIGVPMVLGPIAGPVLGGWLVQDVSWRWIFLVNVPVGVAVLGFAWRVLPRDGAVSAGERLDWRGVALLVPGLALVVLGLAELAGDGALLARVVVPLGAGIVLVSAFGWHAWRLGSEAAANGGRGARSADGGGVRPVAAASELPRDRAGDAGPLRPLLDVRLLAVPSVAASALTLLLLGAAFLGSLFLLALFFQVGRGASALATGLLLAPQGVGAAVTMPLAGRAADRFGAGRVVLAGLVPFAAATLALTQVGVSTSDALLVAILLVFGLGMGATMMPAMTAAYRTLARPQVAHATALLTIVQRVGSSIGTALVAVVLGAALPAAGSSGGANAADTAAAFAGTFWIPVALVAAAVLPAAFLSRDAAAAPAAPAPPPAPPRRPREANPASRICVPVRGERSG